MNKFNKLVNSILLEQLSPAMMRLAQLGPKLVPEKSNQRHVGGCLAWARSAKEELEAMNDPEFGEIRIMGVERGLYENYKFDNHFWVQVNVGGYEMILDGTAVQVDPQYKDGFYGKSNNIPESLEPIYRHPNVREKR